MLGQKGYGALPVTQKSMIMKRKKKPSQPKYFGKGSGYERDQTLRFFMPWPLVALCRIAEVAPDELLHNFMNDLAHDSWKRPADDAIRSLLSEYFILRGYGKEYYAEEDIRTMFKEMDAVGMLWPETNNGKLIDRHARWRNKYQKFWFKKWYYKIRRHKPSTK
jgi:hypothetical protein